jgi:hypothetical protein
MQGDYAAAAALIRLTSPDRHPLYHLIAAIIYAQLGLVKEAEEERAIYVQERPDFIRNWSREWSRRLRRPEDRARADDGARKAGFIAPLEAVTGAALVPTP